MMFSVLLLWRTSKKRFKVFLEHKYYSFFHTCKFLFFVLFHQIGAYDQQIWEKSVEQREIKVETVSSLPTFFLFSFVFVSHSFTSPHLFSPSFFIFLFFDFQSSPQSICFYDQHLSFCFTSSFFFQCFLL